MRFQLTRWTISQAEDQQSMMSTKQNSEETNVYLGKNSFFEGKLTLEGIFRLDGKVHGEIYHKGTLIMSETGTFKGKIEVSSLILNGKIEGEVKATERIEIHSRGQLFGVIHTPVLVVQDGGVFEGNCTMVTKSVEESAGDSIESRLSEISSYDS